MSCPHYTETERTVGFLTELVCRDCNARLAPPVVEPPFEEDPGVAPVDVPVGVLGGECGDPDCLDCAGTPLDGEDGYVETQAVLNEAYALGILEEPLSAEGVESARIEDDTLIETIAAQTPSQDDLDFLADLPF